MAAIVITITGKQISCPREHRKYNGQVQWECAQPFTVDFGWDTPLRDGLEKLEGVHDAAAGVYRTPVDVRIGADSDKKGSPKQFKYVIAVWDGTNVLTEDPEIIIDP